MYEDRRTQVGGGREGMPRRPRENGGVSRGEGGEEKGRKEGREGERERDLGRCSRRMRSCRHGISEMFRMRKDRFKCAVQYLVLILPFGQVFPSAVRLRRISRAGDGEEHSANHLDGLRIGGPKAGSSSILFTTALRSYVRSHGLAKEYADSLSIDSFMTSPVCGSSRIGTTFLPT